METLAAALDVPLFDYPNDMCVMSHQHSLRAPQSVWDTPPQVLQRDITADDDFYTCYAELQQTKMVQTEAFEWRYNTTSVVQRRWRRRVPGASR